MILQFFSELQSANPVLPQYYSSTAPYYKVLLRNTKYYSSTQYYSNTTPYQKVLLQRPAGRWTQYWPAGRDTWKRPAGRRETAGRPAGDEIANKSPVLSHIHQKGSGSRSCLQSRNRHDMIEH